MDIKEIKWMGSSYKDIKNFPKEARQELGYNLDRLQRGLEPSDYKPMHVIGLGVKELRVHLENEYRAIYVVKYAKAIYVLHVFVKKTQKTSKKDIELARGRFRKIEVRRLI